MRVSNISSKATGPIVTIFHIELSWAEVAIHSFAVLAGAKNLNIKR